MKTNKPLSLLVLLAAASAGAWADPVAQVLSSTPVYQQVAVPQQSCTQQPVTTVSNPTPGVTGGTVFGALVGGVLGNNIGNGSGRALATAVGVAGGAVLGTQMDPRNNPSTTTQVVQQCTTQTRYENQLLGYDVVYEYAGQRYTTRLPQDPGRTLRIQVSPAMGDGAITPAAPPVAPGHLSQAVPAGALGTSASTVTGVSGYAPTTVSLQTTYYATVPQQVVVVPAAPVYVTPAHRHPAPVFSVGYHSGYPSPRGGIWGSYQGHWR